MWPLYRLVEDKVVTYLDVFVDGGINASRQRIAGNPTDTGSHAILCKDDALLRHFIQVGCVHVRIECTQDFHGPVVGIKEHNVETIIVVSLGLVLACAGRRRR